ncbi:SusC/RagA family TonB-linked outer membrane protein [Flagellimonas sp.]|uniref:SusC/RagA family TonB-linked outer membrane protein n=1 Tax=Flagellimonas sp. TaxID=2058762 RepID=UPI003B5C1895
MKVKKLFGTFVFMLLCIASVQSQEKTITGTITDQTGAPLPGVNIVVQGTTNGTQSDFDGNYVITASVGQTLVYTYLGQRTTQREVGVQDVVNVQMEEDAQALEEVVVTGSASGKSLKELSFALGQVKNELLENVPATSAAAALQGKVSGVSISSPGGQPGSNVSIQLRTANSLSTGQDPLVIVDGVILEGGLADINTEDIDRIEIAKGAAGASLYGSRAANGVIQIFTKRGKGNNKINVTYRSEIGVKEITSKYDLATTHRFKLTADGSAFDLSSGSREVDDDGLSDNPYPISRIFNYQDDIFTTGVFNTHYASVSGGDEKTRYLFSYQRLQDEGIYVLVDDYRRDNFRLNLDNNLSDKISLKTSLFYSNSNRDASINSGTTVGILFPALITEPIYDWNAVNEEDGSPFNYDSNTFDPNIKNPLYTLANNDKTEKRNRVLGNVSLDYRVTPWLKLNGSYSYDFENNTFEDYIPKGYLSDDPDGQAQNIGFIQRSNFNGRAQNTRFNALFSPFSVDSDFNLALRFSYLHERYESEFNNSEGYNLAVSGIRSLDNITDPPSLSSQAQEILTDSYFVIADFDYKSKYIISGVARREGSSLFGPNTRWANYFRTSLAYRVTEDIEIPGVQELKLRASYGTAGIRPSYEMRFETFELRNGSPTRATIGNNDLKPAKTGELELGLNMNFLDRFSFEFNYVKAKTEDQILRVPLSAAAGFSAQWRNAGEIDATTYEASLNANIVRSDNVTWDLGIVWDKSEQKVSRLDVPAYLTGPGTQETTLFRIEEGQNFGVMYGNDFIRSLSDLPAGLTPSDYTINSAGFVVDQATGETPVRRADASGNEFFVIGDITPDFRMGINTTFNYKNLSLYALVDWKQGGDIYNKTKQWLYRDGRHTDITSGLPYNFYQGLYNVNLPSSAFVEDGTFVKLRELSLYYTLKGESLGNIGNFINAMKFGFVGRNLLTFTDYSGFDPEITHQSETNRANLTTRDTDGIGNDPNTPGGDPNIFKVDNFPYPTTKTYSFSVQLTF